MVRNLPDNAGDSGLVPGLGRYPREGNDNPLQYSCQINPMDRGAWRATVHVVAKSWTRLNTHTHTNFKALRFIISLIALPLHFSYC